MANSTISMTIAGRVYRMACGEGEEDHLRELGRRLDAKIAELRGSFGEIGDQRIIVMAALTMADDLAEAEQRVEALKAEVAGLKDRRTAEGAIVEAAESAVATAIEQAAARIEGVAQAMLTGVRS